MGVTAARLPHGLHNGAMSELKDRLRSDLTTAIKARDELRSSTLRMVLSAITNAEVAGKEARELSDDDIVGVLSHRGQEAPRGRDRLRRRRPHRDRRQGARRGGRDRRLPARSSSTRTRSPSSSPPRSQQTGAAGEGMRAMGKVMGAVQPQVKGRADGGAVAAEVRRQLG